MRQPFSKKKFHSLCSSSLSELRRYWKHFPRSPLVFPRCWQLSQTPRKRQPLSSSFFLFFSPSPLPLPFKVRGELSMNHPSAPAVFPTVSPLRQAAWVMGVTEETPALNRRWQRGRGRRRGVEGGRRTAWWEKHTARQQTCRDYHL